MLLMSACASLPPQTGRTETHALTDTANTRLGTAFAPGEAAHPGDNAFHLLPDGMDALIARVILSEAADRTLDLQYYIWHDDLTGREMAASILRAADRGVRVRLLLDDLGTNADDQVLLALASHPNVQVRLFNPVANRTLQEARLRGRVLPREPAHAQQGADRRQPGRDSRRPQYRRRILRRIDARSRSAISTCSCTGRSCAKCRPRSTNTGTRMRPIRSRT